MAGVDGFLLNEYVATANLLLRVRCVVLPVLWRKDPMLVSVFAQCL